jgi:hypothetical protein
MTAGPVVDQLASDYAAQPVVFLEQYVYNPVGSRYSRWWAAYGGGTAYLPLIMVDSGHQISNGSVSFYDVYKGMVDAELTRPAQAYIQASCWRVQDRVRISGQMTNLSGVTLSSSGNGATIHAIVYEDAHLGVTDRYVRDAPSIPIASGLANGGTMTFTLETTDLTGVNWDNLHTVVLADYRPAGSSVPFDMLQAARATWIVGNPIYISQDGSCGGYSPCFQKIQDGIASASNQTSIKITQGTYEEDVVLGLNETIHLEGGWDPAFTTHSGQSAIKGSLTISNGEVIVENIILR